MVVPVNPVGIAPAIMKPLEPQAFYVVTYQLGTSSFLEPAPSDWPLTPAPLRIDQTWTWRQVHMLGRDIVPGKRSFDLPPKPPQRLPYYGTEWRQVGMLGRDKLPFGGQVYDRQVLQPYGAGQTWTLNLLETTLATVVVTGPLGVVANQYDWPLPRVPGRIDETWAWRQVGMLGQDYLLAGEQSYDLTPKSAPRAPYYGTEWRQVGMLGLDKLPVGDQIYDLSPKAPQRSPYYGTEWRQVQMLGFDQMLVGQQIYDRPMRAPLRAVELHTWIQSVNLALTVVQPTLPFNQYDWPLPRAPQQAAPSWTWRQVGMLGLDKLPVGEQVFNLPVRGLRLAIYDWIQATNLALLVPPAGLLPFNRHDWALPVRGPAQFDRSFTLRSQFLVSVPVFIGAQYFLLQPHYVNNAWLPAWTTVTEGHEVPVGWIPTLMVDPLNDQAVSAFYAAGPRRGYPGPGYDWQGFNYFTARRTAAIQSPVTHWKEVSPGMYALTGLGSGRPPVGG